MTDLKNRKTPENRSPPGSVGFRVTGYGLLATGFSFFARFSSMRSL
jgi:hypothetical protein